jgi:hypothetical protein
MMHASLFKPGFEGQRDGSDERLSMILDDDGGGWEGNEDGQRAKLLYQYRRIHGCAETGLTRDVMDEWLNDWIDLNDMNDMNDLNDLNDCMILRHLVESTSGERGLHE